MQSCLLNVTALFVIKDAALHIKYVAKQSKPHSGHDQSQCQNKEDNKNIKYMYLKPFGNQCKHRAENKSRFAFCSCNQCVL